MRPLLAFLVSALGRMLVPFMRRVPDLEHAERIGIDRPSFFERVLMKLFRYREIKAVVDGQETLYLRRFFLTPRRWPLRIFLHHICRSDSDRSPHDHPFDFDTTILNKEYVEYIDVDRWLANGDYIEADVRVGRAGDTLSNPAEHVHRLSLLSPMWTLVLVSRARRIWGFVTKDCWKPWRKYLNLPDEPESLEDV